MATKLTSVSLAGKLGYRMTLPLADGITVLTGNNAAGKTILAGTIADIMYPSAKPAKGIIESLSWQRDGIDLSCMVQNTGKQGSPIWRMSKDGEAIGHRLIKDAKAWLRQELPLSYGAFTTINFIAAFRSATVLSGNPAARQALMSEIVGLTVFDELRKAMQAMQSNERVTVEVRARLEAEISKLSSFNDVRIIRRIDTKLSTLQRIKTEAKITAERLAEQLDADRPLAAWSDEKLATFVKNSKKTAAAWDAYEAYEAEPKRRPLDPHELRKALYLEKWANKYPAFSQLMRGKLDLVDKPEALRKSLFKLQSARVATMSALDHITKAHATDKCPTCGSAINRKAVVKVLKRDLAATDAALIPLHAQSEAMEATVELAALNALLTTEPYKYKALTLSAARKLFGRIAEMKATSEHNTNCKTLAVVSKPKTPRVDNDKLEAARDEIAMRARGFVIASDAAEFEYDKAVNAHNLMAAYIRKLSDHREMQSTALYEQKRRSELAAELERLPRSDDAELVQELITALDNKRARNRYLELVGEHLISTLNELAPAFFSYKMEFAWHNGSIIANRNGAADDVATLSGRESRTFLLLNAVATQSCLPPASRLNTLVVDEIEAGAQLENRVALAELLPTMLDYYSNILVVTPQSFADFPVQGRRYAVTAEKTLRRIE